MRVETIQLQQQQGKSFPVFIKGGFYHATVQEQTGRTLFSLKINGTVLTAASELPLQAGEQLFVRVKTLAPMPVLELVTMQKVLPKILSGAEPRLAAFIKDVVQARLPLLPVTAKDTEITKEFLHEQAASRATSLSTAITGDKDADAVVRFAHIDSVIRREFGENGMFFMAFPYVENNFVRDGYFSYTPATLHGMEEYRIMADLSALGTILAVVRQWQNTVGIHVYTATDTTAHLIKESFQLLRNALHDVGIAVASLTVKHTGIIKDPVVMLAFSGDESVDVTV